jgi:aspartokinase-like uncharacterized kinase
MIHEAAIPEIITIKIGGSLFDLPRLGERLSTFLLELSPHLPVLVAGGGAIADHVREMDTRQGLGDEKAHWLALRAVTLNACFLKDIITLPTRLVASLNDIHKCWQQRTVPILDAFTFCVVNERHQVRLPHCWQVTTDSLALHLATMMDAEELLMLKSKTCDPILTLVNARRQGLVDDYFETQVAGQLADGKKPVNIRLLNFREWPRASSIPLILPAYEPVEQQ